VIALPSAAEIHRYTNVYRGGPPPRARRRPRWLCSPPPPPPPAGVAIPLQGPAGSGAPPTPPLSGMTLWVNGRNGITSGGGSVSAWADQSGSGNNFSQSTGSAQPTLSSINGHTALAFNPSVFSSMSCAAGTAINNGSAWTIFAVWQFNGSVGYADYNNTILSVFAQILIGADKNGSNAEAYSFQQGTHVAVSGGPATSPHYSMHQQNGSTTMSVAIDGGTPATTTVGSIGNWNCDYLGRNGVTTGSYFNGLIGEVIAWNRALSSGEITTVQNFLHTNWGI
jgi:hypothetical protein